MFTNFIKNKSYLSWILIIFIILGVTLTSYYLAPKKLEAEKINATTTAATNTTTATSTVANATSTKPIAKEINGIYLTAYSAGSPTKVDKIIKSATSTNINAVVIDIKDYSGYLSYDSQIKMVDELKLEQIKIKNIKEVIKKFHDHNFYVIARIAVFQDPLLAAKKPGWAVMNKNTKKIWRDHKGLAWLDPASVEVWKYHVEIAQEAIALGFDEINLDYIRFPSDGTLSTMAFTNWDKQKTKADVIKNFFAYFSKQLKDEPAYLSADLFGLTTTVTNDMNIGQILENAAPYFDYICPMVYPSHYPTGYLGYKNPANYPYEVIFKAIKTANDRLAKVPNNRAKIRPWIQDFNMGAVYTATLIKKEIKANTDAKGYGYLVWDPKNLYTWAAYKK